VSNQHVFSMRLIDLFDFASARIPHF